MITASELGLAVCRSCGAITDAPGTPCKECGAMVHSRIPHSLQKTWAYWIAGLLLYIPGNVFPIMITSTLGNDKGSTIIGGVIALLHHHSYAVAIVVLVASILVPITKFIIIALIALSIQFRWPINTHHRHLAHQAVEFIGRWSMIDVFVVAALAALIQLGSVMAIYPGKAIGFFALSVALTMLSAQSLDPRLMWDHAPEEASHHDG
ncbi:MAG: paraquat-inducible protein A [Pseudomonadota bacterium]